MTDKVNGAVWPGIWVERNTGFLKVTFSIDIKAITSANLSAIGTPTATNPTNAVAAGTIADSTFGVLDGAIGHAIREIETKATVLGVSTYDVASKSVDVFVGHAEGWFAPLPDGVVELPPASPVIQLKGAKAVVTTAGPFVDNTTTVVPVGGFVTVDHGSFPGITYTITYVPFDGRMPLAAVAPGQLVLGPGGTPGSTPPNSPTGTPGYYPATAPHAS
jgi:hypothetical protein